MSEMEWAEDRTIPTAPEPTNQQIWQALELLDQKLNSLGQMTEWTVNTLKWMSGVFQGLQSVAMMMPGKGGKMARDMVNQMNGESK